ncbi:MULTISPECIES: hypothetical protein [unclassified Streptomyces]|uniref:hypothetical protein n=1 Tax=unclassified Streptomyces TaxID=2593676 RepID=UPI0036ECE4BA
MTSLFQRLDEEEAIVRGELSALREKITVAEERLARLTITRETAESLLGGGASTEGPQAASEEAGQAPPASSSPRGSAEVSASADGDSSGASAASGTQLDWEVAREQMLVLLAGAGRAMKVQDICATIGEDVTSTRWVETTRSRLKRMAKEGRVVEGPTAYFAIAPTAGGHRQEGVGMR